MRWIVGVFVIGILCLSLGIAAPEGADAKKLVKTMAGKTEQRAILNDLHSERWFVRCMAVVESRKYKNPEILGALAAAALNEPHPIIRAFLFECLATWDRASLRAAVCAAVVDKAVKRLNEPKLSVFEAESAVRFLTVLTDEIFAYEFALWEDHWKGARAAYDAEQTAAAAKLPPPPPPVEKPNPNDPPKPVASVETVVPKDLEKRLKQLEESGVDLCVVMDDTGSMENAIHTAQRGISYLMNSMKAIAKDARFGMITYKDTVHRRLGFTSSAPAAQAFIDAVEADGGNDYEEGVDRGFAAAMSELTWRKEALKFVVIVGDAPCHDEDFPGFLENVKKAAEKGVIVHALCVNEPNVPGFREVTEAANGVKLTVGRPNQLLIRMLELVFGNEQSDEIEFICSQLLRFQELYKPKPR